MIKKLRNQPHAPKSGASSQIGAKRKKILSYTLTDKGGSELTFLEFLSEV
jgi:hypothetical protein